MRKQTLVETNPIESAVSSLRRDELSLTGMRLERCKYFRSRITGHGVLAPDLELWITWLVGVIREDDRPALRARVSEQAHKRRDDRLGARIRELAGDEVVEHVDDDQSFHGPRVGADRG